MHPQCRASFQLTSFHCRMPPSVPTDQRHKDAAFPGLLTHALPCSPEERQTLQTSRTNGNDDPSMVAKLRDQTGRHGGRACSDQNSIVRREDRCPVAAVAIEDDDVCDPKSDQNRARPRRKMRPALNRHHVANQTRQHSGLIA